jgi:hypothetical protein
LKSPGLVFAIPAWKAAGAAIVGGDRVAGAEAALYVRPALVEIGGQAGPVERETFAPILYVIKHSDFDAVLAQCRSAGFVVFDLHQRSAQGRCLPIGARLRLRDRQREHRTFGRTCIGQLSP